MLCLIISIFDVFLSSGVLDLCGFCGDSPTGHSPGLALGCESGLPRPGREWSSQLTVSWFIKCPWDKKPTEVPCFPWRLPTFTQFMGSDCPLLMCHLIDSYKTVFFCVFTKAFLVASSGRASQDARTLYEMEFGMLFPWHLEVQTKAPLKLVFPFPSWGLPARPANFSLSSSTRDLS